MIYGVHDRPPLFRAILLGFQHVLTMFSASVSVPLLLSPAMGLNHEKTTMLISAVMLSCGIATIIQTTIGNRLPIVQGVSFSFLGPFFAIIAFAKNAELSLQYIAGAILIGSIFEILVGYTGIIGKLRDKISPVVIGPVIMLIGLALFQVGAPKAGRFWPLSGLVLVSIIVFSLVLSRKIKIIRILPILSAIVVGYLVATLLTVSGIIGPSHPAFVDFKSFLKAAWIRTPDELILPWGPPKFSLAFALAILAGYIASMIESFGDYHACLFMAGESKPTKKMINRGIGAEGLGCFTASLLGGLAATSYSENIGLIGITKVASRYVVLISGFILIVLGLFSKFGALIATIPEPIIGALYCALFGLISAVGIQQVAKADLKSDRNMMIIGISLFMGLSIPAYINGVPALGFASGREAIAEVFPKIIADAISTIGATGMAVTAILGLILDNLIPGSDKERGLDINES